MAQEASRSAGGQQAAEGGGGTGAAGTGGAAGEAPGADGAPGAARRRLPPGVRAAALAAVVLVVLGGVAYYLHARHFEDTDDAQIDGHLNPISARVSGTVLRLNPQVQDNQFVTAGTVLLEVDPADYQADLARAGAEVERLKASAAASQAEIPVTSANATGQLRAAEAALSQSRDGVATEQANLGAAKARAAQAEATAKRAAADLERYSGLAAKQEISRAEFDQHQTEARTAEAALEAARADVLAAANRVSQAQAKVVQQEADLGRARTAPQQIAETRQRFGSASADVQRAAAQLETARLNLSYTRITAPVSGIVGRKSVEVGQRVQPGQELLTIIQLDDIWVTANFKETQLRLMHPGQPALVHVDSYDRDYRGQVESIAAATGARFSLLPPENASGNFVKVVQRLPVRVRLEPGQDPSRQLRPGMSVEASVTVR